MGTIPELQKIIDEETEKLNDAKVKYNSEMQTIHEEMILHAKYKIGQKVETSHGTGIIKMIHTREKYSDKLSIGYSIGKRTKSGELHKSHDLYYTGYIHPEAEVKEIDK